MLCVNAFLEPEIWLLIPSLRVWGPELRPHALWDVCLGGV